MLKRFFRFNMEVKNCIVILSAIVFIRFVCSPRFALSAELRIVNGTWGEWEEWSECSKTCGHSQKFRIRKCFPPPLEAAKIHSDRNRILDCPGGHKAGIEITKCKVSPCPVDGYWGSWSTYGPCSVTCGTGKRIRVRQCDNPKPKFGGSQCEGRPTDTASCKTGTRCPVHGGWSDWSSWSACSVSCGRGQMQRFRTCDNPTPAFNGEDCEGRRLAVSSCNAPIECPVDGKWTSWSEWGPCVRHDCNVAAPGRQVRFRSCTSPRPRWGGKMCQGNFFDSALCVDDFDNCPVDGNWGPWSPWNCGEEHAMRSRSCDNPEPRNGGRRCADDDAVEFIDAMEELNKYVKTCNRSPLNNQGENPDDGFTEAVTDDYVYEEYDLGS